MPLRLRVSSDIPNTTFRIWFLAPNDSRNVLDLKRAFCEGIKELRAIGLSHDDFKLELDEFQLLDDSRLDVLRDGDLVTYVSSMCIHFTAITIMQSQASPSVSQA
jgi:hypothetical protein